ncbi:nuclear transport factor 2 family protein [Sediminibacter sp. Hel_I_10]|uniref:nuclear transport factor 2 family protein n=1 Tax=Sediminibacter sp. Hel_I_10 TaxID=1392490 RepID=UPI0018CC5341|nr:nuclear transport factor 2 family protein [Sediminibacter sp. Hel_I_10]
MKETARHFVELYFRFYGERNSIIKNLFDEDFMGLDGITNTIYDKTKWINAIDDDFEQIGTPFKVGIIDFDTRELGDGMILASCISIWDIKLFQDFPEFDRVRTVFIIRKENDTFKIKHLSNSISLLSLTKKELFPFTLRKVLMDWKNTLFYMGKKQ